MSNKKHIVLAMSGGIDSVVSAYWLKSKDYDVLAVYFSNYSLVDSSQRNAVSFFCKELNISLETVDFSFYKKLPIMPREKINSSEHSLPNAIFFLLSALCLIATRIDASCISLGITKEDDDKYPNIASALKDITKSISWSIYADRTGHSEKIQAIFPFSKKDKVQLIKKAQDFGVPIEQTYSCSQGKHKHCGICSCCRNRHNAFLNAGIADKTCYEKQKP